MVGIHANSLLNVISKLGEYSSHLRDYETIISTGFNETISVDEGILKPITKFADPDEYGMVFKGPQFTIGNPWYKTPKSICDNQHDYEVVNLAKIDEEFYSRTNFIPGISTNEYTNKIAGFEIACKDGKKSFGNWLDEYKLAFRCQLSQPQERTLICAILPRKTAHIHAVISILFRNRLDCIDMAALCSSLVLDFFIKTTGAGGLFPSRMASFPIRVKSIFQSALYSRILLLNCLTKHYGELWKDCWKDSYNKEKWSIDDSRLKPFAKLNQNWDIETPLRNYFERRQALVEIDVISSMALGLCLQDLEMIYSIQFPVLQQNENDTWYDQKGNIVFTCSKGLTGVGLDRKQWEAIRNQKEGETYVHTIDPAKSELYGGQQVTYYAPYTKCDRIEDYRRAWAHFEKIFKEEE